jgi:hypothetical protein
MDPKGKQGRHELNRILKLFSPLDIIPYYLDSFNTNYIIFRNVEIFKKEKFFKEKFEGNY